MFQMQENFGKASTTTMSMSQSQKIRVDYMNKSFLGKAS